MRDSEKTRTLIDEAVTILKKYLSGKTGGNDSVKVALSTLQLHAKLVSAESNRDMVVLAAVKMMENKKEEMLISKNLPHLLPEK